MIRVILGVSAANQENSISLVKNGIIGHTGPAWVTIESVHFTNIGGGSGTNWAGLAIVGDIGQVDPTVPNNLIAIAGAPNTVSTTDSMNVRFKIKNMADLFNKPFTLKFQWLKYFSTQTWVDVKTTNVYECILTLTVEPI